MLLPLVRTIRAAAYDDDDVDNKTGTRLNDSTKHVLN